MIRWIMGVLAVIAGILGFYICRMRYFSEICPNLSTYCFLIAGILVILIWISSPNKAHAKKGETGVRR
jgi:tellurite resistance protein TehA-like permease